MTQKLKIEMFKAIFLSMGVNVQTITEKTIASKTQQLIFVETVMDVRFFMQFFDGCWPANYMESLKISIP